VEHVQADRRSQRFGQGFGHGPQSRDGRRAPVRAPFFEMN
jgi:hypothetical protein